jgi:hypothetical protein
MQNGNEGRTLESLKLDHDTFKHLTTISTGSILILSTFIEKFFQNPSWKGLIAFTFVSLMVCTYTSVIEMFRISHEGLARKSTNKKRTLWSKMVPLLSCGCFLLGILSLVVFSLRNFLR